MTDLTLDCSACGKKFRISFAVKPKQVACPQCKAKVSTSAEPAATGAPPAGDAAVSPKADASTPATTPVRATTGAKSQPKPRHLPTLLKPENVEFKGWTYDREAEQARGGLQKADIMGVIWIGGVFFMIGFILFRLLKSKIVGEGLMGLGVLGLLVSGYLFLQLRKKLDESACMKCHGVLGLMHTIPSEQDCKAGNYTRGASGYAYRLENGPTQKVWEIHKKWHVCKACKRYFLAEKESLDFVGATKVDMEKREALYAEAAAAAAALVPVPQPAAPTAEPPSPGPAAVAEIRLGPDAVVSAETKPV